MFRRRFRAAAAGMRGGLHGAGELTERRAQEEEREEQYAGKNGHEAHMLMVPDPSGEGNRRKVRHLFPISSKTNDGTLPCRYYWR